VTELARDFEMTAGSGHAHQLVHLPGARRERIRHPR